MKCTAQFKVFILSQCPEKTALLTRKARHCGLDTRIFSGESDCLENICQNGLSLLVMDTECLPCSTSLLLKVRGLLPRLPIWCIIPNSSIPLAVQCMHAGASEILEMPISESHIEILLRRLCRQITNPETSSLMRLSPAEKNVLQHILQGLTNQQIAETMDRSIRTIEDHRSSIMKKLGVQNAVDLIRRARQLDLDSE